MNTDEHRFEAKPAALEESTNNVSERIIGCRTRTEESRIRNAEDSGQTDRAVSSSGLSLRPFFICVNLC
jgi:hypothetical protein